MFILFVADTEVAGRDQDETVLTHQSKPEPGPAGGLSLVLRHLAALQIKRFHHSRWVIVWCSRCDSEPTIQEKPARLHL